ncbi:hypothetical protein APHAL10511_004012 [Amanita phalloides]|nr:hypothetical protein APHAL10511_004012 [Amanita phalloides]
MPKSLKNRKYKTRPLHEASTKLRKPFTPLRRFFFKLEMLAPSPNVPALLGKRRREELLEDEAGFEHLHGYDHTTAVETVLVSRQSKDADGSLSTPIKVYAPDGSRSRTKKPVGPRSLRSLRRRVPSGLSLLRKGGVLPVTTPPCATPRPLRCTSTPGSARLALQNVDSTLDNDAIIITALDRIPFDKHEDLLAMSREELVNVAKIFNAKLPLALSIDTSDDRPANFIRNAIEILVGIRSDVPAAPLRNGKMKMPQEEDPRFFEEFSFEKRLEEMESLSPFASPLSSRRVKSGDWSTQLHEMLHIPRKLEPLEEVTEDNFTNDEDSRRKRTRLASWEKTNQEFDSDIMMQQNASILLSFSLPAPTECQVQEPSQSTSAAPCTRILRSGSQKFREYATSSAPAPIPPIKPKRTRANTKRKAKVEKHGRESVASESSASIERNTVVFPKLRSTAPDAGSESNWSGSGHIASNADSIDRLILSSMGGSTGQSECSTNSAFLSIKSKFSSMSKMSICTASTKDSRRVNKMGEMSTAESGGSGMDVSQ